MSAHPLAGRRGWLAAVASQVSRYLLEPLEETVVAEPVELEPHLVVAVVSAAPRSGATTIARMLAAELAVRADGGAVVASPAVRRGGPPSRAAIRLSTALAGAAVTHPSGRLCAAAGDPATIVNAGRYLAPVVLDVPPDGSAIAASAVAGRALVVGGDEDEPALVDAVASILAEHAERRPLTVANRVTDPDRWRRVDVCLPPSKLAARAATLGVRPLGALGAAIARLADALERD